MGVAAQLNIEVGVLIAGQVCRHHRGGSAEECKFRGCHPPVPDGDELGHSGRGLSAKDLEGICAIDGWNPLAMSRTRNLGPRIMS